MAKKPPTPDEVVKKFLPSLGKDKSLGDLDKHEMRERAKEAMRNGDLKKEYKYRIIEYALEGNMKGVKNMANTYEELSPEFEEK